MFFFFFLASQVVFVFKIIIIFFIVLRGHVHFEGRLVGCMSIFIDARGKPHAFLVLFICVHSRHVPIPNDESLSILSLCKGYVNDPDIQATVQNNQVFH